MEEATPSIYYMVSWLEDHFKNKTDIYLHFEPEGVSPFFIPEGTVQFSIMLYFFDKFIKEREQCYISEDSYRNSKLILQFEFKFDDFTKGENILTKIKSRINEELEKNSRNLTFDTDFVKIEISYMIIHPPDAEKKMFEAY